MIDTMQTPDTKSTMPPGPADAAALEHANKLSQLDRERGRRRVPSGLFRDLAEGWAVLGGSPVK